eukprot:5415602-Prorocentrum_lima.AAC.1
MASLLVGWTPTVLSFIVVLMLGRRMFLMPADAWEVMIGTNIGLNGCSLMEFLCRLVGGMWWVLSIHIVMM